MNIVSSLIQLSSKLSDLQRNLESLQESIPLIDDDLLEEYMKENELKYLDNHDMFSNAATLQSWFYAIQSMMQILNGKVPESEHEMLILKEVTREFRKDGIFDVDNYLSDEIGFVWQLVDLLSWVNAEVE